MDYFVNKVKSIADVVNFEFEIKSSYPAWELDTDSEIKDITAKVLRGIIWRKTSFRINTCGS